MHRVLLWGGIALGLVLWGPGTPVDIGGLSVDNSQMATAISLLAIAISPLAVASSPLAVATSPLAVASSRVAVAGSLLAVVISPLAVAGRPLAVAISPLDSPFTLTRRFTMSRRFPRTEAEIAALALRVAEGLEKKADDFPNPPISAEELRSKLEVFRAADTATVAAETAFREQHAVKDEALEDLEDAVKAELRYAEVAVREQPEKLNALGWRPPRDGLPLEPPGETRDISIVSEGDTWAILRWKAPANGGAPTFYRVQRRQEGAAWQDAATATESEALMSNQPRGVELFYRVIAVNRAGAGQPSATVSLVL